MPVNSKPQEGDFVSILQYIIYEKARLQVIFSYLPKGVSQKHKLFFAVP
jgi:hypothetical protein